MIASRPLAAAGALVAALALSACGAPAAGGGGAPDCSTDLAVSSGAGEFTATHAAAASLEGGRAYTAYASDAEIDAEQITMFSGPSADGSGLVTISITRFNAVDAPVIEPGTVPVGAETGELTFVVLLDAGGSTMGNNMGATGEVEVTQVGDTLCFEIDYSDDEKSVSGTVSASVKTF